jgi:hypothetical protein
MPGEKRKNWAVQDKAMFGKVFKMFWAAFG